MNNLDIRDFTDIPQAIRAIEQVISGEQPISRALQILSDNTRLPVINETLPAKAQQQLRDAPDYRLRVRINREFAPETAVLVEYGDKNSTLQAVYQKLVALHRYLLAIQNAPVPGVVVITGYDPKTAPSIALPRGERKLIPTMKGPYTGSARDLLTKDIRDLRNYTNAPPSAIKDLLKLNKEMYSKAFTKIR